MRDFRLFQQFCYAHRGDYNYLAFKGAFDRVEQYREYNRNGHFIQLFYSIYDFFCENPDFLNRVDVPPFEISDDYSLLKAWENFIENDNNDAEGFTTESLRKNLSPSCGGYRHGGGGWSPIAKIMFPTVAIYMINTGGSLR